MSEASIGIMEGAFFVPKSEILHWINSTLQLNLTKIEQLGTGAAYCQIIDVLFPGSIKLSRINWRARNEWEFIVNLKILQQAFQKNNIKKHIEIERISKAKYQDNLEFAQWMKRFFDLSNGPQLVKDYDATSKRNSQEVEFSFIELRDNSRMAAMRGGREDKDSSNDGRSKKYQKYMTRSKSPIVVTRLNRSHNNNNTGNVSKDATIATVTVGSKVSQQLLQKQRDDLLAKLQDINAILLSSLTDSNKLKDISAISASVQNMKISQQYNTHKDSVQTHEGEDNKHANNHKNENNSMFAAILEEDENNTKKTIDRDEHGPGKSDQNINGSSAAKGIEETAKSQVIAQASKKDGAARRQPQQQQQHLQLANGPRGNKHSENIGQKIKHI